MRVPAFICINSYAGRLEKPCFVIGETPQKYRITVELETFLPRKVLAAGGECLVPKTAIKFK